MSRPRAPTAMRRPISRVRSVTDTSMMFMMPMPPTSRDTEAMAASSTVSTRDDASCGLEHLGEVAEREVVLLVGLQPVALAEELADLLLGRLHVLAVARRLTEIALDRRGGGWVGPSTRLLAVEIGISTTSSWSWPQLRLALARRARRSR